MNNAIVKENVLHEKRKKRSFPLNLRNSDTTKMAKCRLSNTDKPPHTSNTTCHLACHYFILNILFPAQRQQLHVHCLRHFPLFRVGHCSVKLGSLKLTFFPSEWFSLVRRRRRRSRHSLLHVGHTTHSQSVTQTYPCQYFLVYPQYPLITFQGPKYFSSSILRENQRSSTNIYKKMRMNEYKQIKPPYSLELRYTTVNQILTYLM